MIDLIVICGMPRTGTTFMHDLFANYKLGENFFALHSQSEKGKLQNALTTSEPYFLATYYRLNQPINDHIRKYVTFWRNWQDNHDLSIVYKHPQLIFYDPISEDFNFRVKYILHIRDFFPWKESMINFKAHLDFNLENTESLYKEHWGQNWEIPPGIDDRLEHLYVRLQWYINNFKDKLRRTDWAIFNYDKPIDSLAEIFAMLHINKDPREMLNLYWRTKDV